MRTVRVTRNIAFASELRVRLAYLVLLGLSVLCSGASAQTIWVDDTATGSNNGTNWVNAYTDLQTALGVATSGSVINVAQGTYRPGPTTSARTVTFVIPIGVSVYGGWAGGAGGATSLGSRENLFRQTILSGDFAQTPSTPGDDAYHVVAIGFGSTRTRLDGFTIQDGLADGSSASLQDRGAGIFILQANAWLENCFVIECDASELGGAIYFDGRVNSGSGEGLAVVKCGIYENTAGLQGGGIWMTDFNDAEPESNDAASFIYNSTFYGNHAGAVDTNLSTQGGGALWVGPIWTEGVTLDVCNTRFFDNSVSGRGSAMWVNNGAVRFGNNTVTQNVVLDAPLVGGNPAPGGTLFYLASASGTLNSVTNTIVYGNTDVLNPGSIYGAITAALPTVSYSDIQWDGLTVYPGTGNIDSDPLFVSAGFFNFELQNGSPCINQGDQTILLADHPDFNTNMDWDEAVPIEFFVTQARVVADEVEMGAHEYN